MAADWPIPNAAKQECSPAQHRTHAAPTCQILPPGYPAHWCTSTRTAAVSARLNNTDCQHKINSSKHTHLLLPELPGDASKGATLPTAVAALGLLLPEHAKTPLSASIELKAQHTHLLLRVMQGDASNCKGDHPREPLAVRKGSSLTRL